MWGILGDSEAAVFGWAVNCKTRQSRAKAQRVELEGPDTGQVG